MVILIASVNVRHLCRQEKWDTPEMILRQLQVDIICLQECGLPNSRDYALFRNLVIQALILVRSQ